jgi:hypothetical protein
MRVARVGEFLARVILVVMAMAAMLAAQAPGTGAIAGSVTDPSGALLRSARVSAVSEETQFSRDVTTGSDGLFRVPLLRPGDYSITVTAPGFEAKTLHGIHVTVTETAVVDVGLAVAKAAATRIEVLGVPELAQTQSSALGRVTDEKDRKSVV